jgi:hypothetical protein
LNLEPHIHEAYIFILNNRISSENTNKNANTKHKTFAIAVAALAIPVKPKIPAIIDRIKNVNIQDSIDRLAKLAPVICRIRETIKKIKKKIKNIFAISIEIAATPPKPSTPAMIAIIRKVRTQPNI